jgi:hypothetical protein
LFAPVHRLKRTGFFDDSGYGLILLFHTPKRRVERAVIHSSDDDELHEVAGIGSHGAHFGYLRIIVLKKQVSRFASQRNRNAPQFFVWEAVWVSAGGV